ncbi:MAG TPA: carbohydrate ABC transporter permease [candidate division Zixibacteria bacterium]|nr:carbohydrate ABC transporter permease [candidate division Zixibacteria bacterium]
MSTRWLITLFLILILGVMVFPMLYMIVLSFQAPGTFAVDLSHLSWILKNYSVVFKSNNFGRYFFNSVFVAIVVTLGNMLLCAMIGYGLSRGPRRLTWPMFILAVAMLMIPAHILILPIFQMMLKFGWFDTYWALTIPWLVTPLGIFLMKQYIDGLPPDLEDAARVDGAGELSIFFRVVLPLCAPALAVLGIQTFLTTWNSFLFPKILTNSNEMYTLPVGLALMQDPRSSDWPVTMAGSVIAALPVIIFFLIFQKKITEGITAGALKQ